MKHSIAQSITWLRKIRNLLFYIISPFDSLFLRINGLQKYPPIQLRRHVHRLGTLDGTGSEFTVYLKLLADLRSDSRLLDIGCGCGILELALEDYLIGGEAIAVDIHQPSISWAKKTIGTRKPNFHFIHSDIYNESYWTRGKIDAKTFFERFREGDFDVIVAKSLFTHMLPAELELYIRELSRRLRHGGRIIMTFFLLNARQQSLALTRNNRIDFQNVDSSTIYALRTRFAPTAAVAYKEDYVMDLIAKNSLECVQPIMYGGWTGRENALHFQDIIVVSRKTSV